MVTRKKKIKANEPEYINERCDNCGLAEWVTSLHQHLDVFGKPICLTCTHEKHFIVRGTKACEHFVRRKNKSVFK